MYDYLYWFVIYSPSYTIFVWSGFRSILRGDRLILRGGGFGLVWFFEDLRRFSGISAISRLGSRR